MSVKCGNCGQHHETVRQVAICHDAVQTNNPATEKQTSYLAALLEQRQVPDGVRALAVGKLSKVDASKLIEECLRHPYKPKPKEKNTTLTTGRIDVECEMPKPGTYTVVFNEEQRRTIRIRKPHPDAVYHVAEYLYGPDNESHFKRFAREVKGGWQYNGDGGILLVGLKVICGADDKKLADMGLAYALESGNCYRCGRKLTVPASIHAGLGPVCARKE